MRAEKGPRAIPEQVWHKNHNKEIWLPDAANSHARKEPIWRILTPQQPLSAPYCEC